MKSWFVSWRPVLTSVFFAVVAALPNCARAQSKSFTVDIASPTNGTFYPSPTSISLIAGVTVANDDIASVEFFDGSNLIGISTSGAVVDPPGSPGLTPGGRAYFCTWSNQTQGIHTLTATATDTNGNSLTSSPVKIQIGNATPPVVQFIQPTNGSTFTAPTNLLLSVSVNDPGVDVQYVAFIANPTVGEGPSLILGVVSNFTSLDPQTRNYMLTWSNASGSWNIVATAFGSNSIFLASATVEVTVTSPPSPQPLQITSPTNGAIFIAPTNLTFSVLVTNPTLDVNYIGFTAAPISTGPTPQYILWLGTVSNFVSAGPATRIYTFTWSNAARGDWLITAAATGSNAVYGDSATVKITVQGGTHYPPMVQITSPANNSDFRAPVNLELVAYANEPNGSVSSVEFFAGTNALGFGHSMRIPVAQPLIPQGATNYPILYVTNTFEFIWSNAPPGSYAVTAMAVDTDKQSATSQPINITILPEVIPPTNKLAIVSIFATDPIAVAGTNCWRWLGGPPTWSNWVSPIAIWQWYTNCGPKDASFTVVRNGSTNDTLTVDYTVSGTASNGVDYAALPGNITIPAGQTEATITLVPVEAVTNVMLKTAILTLRPTTSVPADYTLGFPRSAEAIIVDTQGPQKIGAFLPDGSFHLSLTGPDGAWFHIDYTMDLINWTPLCTNQVVNGTIDFIDPNAGAATVREYRAVPMASTPSN